MEPQSFNDGLVRIYTVSDGAEPGGMPAERTAARETLRFRRRTVGIKRYWQARQANAQVSGLIRCPLRESVSTRDLAALPDGMYRILQVQRPEGISPPVMDLTLERMTPDGTE